MAAASAPIDGRRSRRITRRAGRGRRSTIVRVDVCADAIDWLRGSVPKAIRARRNGVATCLGCRDHLRSRHAGRGVREIARARRACVPAASRSPSAEGRDGASLEGRSVARVGTDRCARGHRPARLALARDRRVGDAGRALGGHADRGARPDQRGFPAVPRVDRDHADLRPLVLRLGVPRGGAAGPVRLAARSGRAQTAAGALALAGADPVGGRRLHVPVAARQGRALAPVRMAGGEAHPGALRVGMGADHGRALADVPRAGHGGRHLRRGRRAHRLVARRQGLLHLRLSLRRVLRARGPRRSGAHQGQRRVRCVRPLHQRLLEQRARARGGRQAQADRRSGLHEVPRLRLGLSEGRSQRGPGRAQAIRDQPAAHPGARRLHLARRAVPRRDRVRGGSVDVAWRVVRRERAAVDGGRARGDHRRVRAAVRAPAAQARDDLPAHGLEARRAAHGRGHGRARADRRVARVRRAHLRRPAAARSRDRDRGGADQVERSTRRAASTRRRLEPPWTTSNRRPRGCWCPTRCCARCARWRAARSVGTGTPRPS